jgi:hypothetical protein
MTLNMSLHHIICMHQKVGLVTNAAELPTGTVDAGLDPNFLIHN